MYTNNIYIYTHTISHHLHNNFQTSPNIQLLKFFSPKPFSSNLGNFSTKKMKSLPAIHPKPELSWAKLPDSVPAGSIHFSMILHLPETTGRQRTVLWSPLESVMLVTSLFDDGWWLVLLLLFSFLGGGRGLKKKTAIQLLLLGYDFVIYDFLLLLSMFGEDSEFKSYMLREW